MYDDHDKNVLGDFKLMLDSAELALGMYRRIVDPVRAVLVDTTKLFNKLTNAKEEKLTGKAIYKLWNESYRGWGTAFNFLPKGWREVKDFRQETQKHVDKYANGDNNQLLDEMIKSVKATMDIAMKKGLWKDIQAETFSVHLDISDDTDRTYWA